MLCHVALARTDISEERIASIIRVTCDRSSKMSVLTRATRCTIPEDGILHSLCHENLKSYTILKLLNMKPGKEKFHTVADIN
jgi:hypothetical protein